MSQDRSSPSDSFNPYAPPSSNLRSGRSVVSAGLPPPKGSVLAVTHDLTDRDLKRFYGLDFFYDPIPWLGFIPQWVILIAVIFAAVEAVVLWAGIQPLDSLAARTGQRGLFGVTAGVLTAAGVAGSSLAKINQLRRAVREGGFLRGRRVTLSDRGVQVEYPPTQMSSGPEFEDNQRRRRAAIAHLPILSQTGVVEADYPWLDFDRVSYHDDYLILWLAGRSRLVVPVRAFPTVNEADAFAHAATGWIAG